MRFHVKVSYTSFDFLKQREFSAIVEAENREEAKTKATASLAGTNIETTIRVATPADEVFLRANPLFIREIK
jgi:hypothetical protein